MNRDYDSAFQSGLPTASLAAIRPLETWYLAYALLGTAVGGILPIIMPLLAFKRFAGAYQVGLLMAAFNLGWLLAPIWGRLADRHCCHRELLIIALLLISAILAVLSYAISLPAWLALSLASGICVAGAVTMGSLFIIEKHPQKEWSKRIGRLQMFNGGGQVVGMLLAALLSDLSLTAALLVAAGITVLAVFPGRLTPKVMTEKRRLEIPSNSREIQNQSEGPNCHPDQKWTILSSAKKPMENLNSDFGWFIVLWSLCLTGSSIICTLYPIIMKDAFGVGQRYLALGFACAMGLSVFLYAEAGRCSQRFGPSQTIRVILFIRLLAFIGLFSVLSLHMFTCGALTFLSFLIIFLCWPFLGVSGTTLSARLSTFGKGEGMGIFNAVFALAAVIGAAMGGWLASWGGYAAAMGMAVVTDGFGLVIVGRIRIP